MANNLLTNPIVLDTFSSDVTIADKPIRIKSISFSSSSAADKLVLEDRKGVTNVYLQLPVAGSTQDWTPAEPVWFQNGLICDVSDGAYVGTARLLIYL